MNCAKTRSTSFVATSAMLIVVLALLLRTLWH